jgi:alkylated DNA repair dioxygenase AlkB
MPLRHYSHLIEPGILNNVLLELNNYMFDYHNIRIMGKTVTQNRRTLYFGDVNFNYSGSSLSKKEFPVHLRQLMRTINTMFSIQCNSCLINYYENGKENISHHSDGKGLYYAF